MQLTPHFSLEEMTRSASALRNGIDNTPPPEVIERLTRVAKTLEIIRSHFNKRIRVSSGYRSPEINRLVGGSLLSAHCKGLAVDFTIDDVPPAVVCTWISDNLTGFDQVIYEFGPTGWCHLGLSAVEDCARQQTLSAVKSLGKTKYLAGIVEMP